MGKNFKTDIKSINKEIKQWILSFIIIIALAFTIRSYVFNVAIVKGLSMEPNFHHGEVVFVNKLNYHFSNPNYNDIVICTCYNGKTEEILIKRVIALPGDVINMEFSDDRYILFVNGEKKDEPYINEIMQQKGDVEYPFEVPKDSYFVMGDNRNASTDSRFKVIGPIPKKNILGKVFFKL